ncbi:MAG: O-antigen ligase family protein [Anaerolineae bacterium]|nr:O-antigen ligase family protein [Anaerolineae bacterium]
MKRLNHSLIAWFCFVLALFCASGVAALLVQRQERLRGALNGLPSADSPLRVPVLGVNADLTQYPPAELNENLDQIRETGFVWVRQVFAWDQIEPAPGEYDWSAYDRIVEEAARRDLRLVAVLWRSPAWAAETPTAPPAEHDDFARFAAAFAERYGDRIDVYQVWDEPNLSSGWGGLPPSPVDYAALLGAAYDAIHAADAHALVLTAGLAPTTERGPQNLSDLLFLEALYDNGAAAVFDGVAAKPYGFDTGPDDRRAYPALLNVSRLLLLRQEMGRRGDAGKPLWASHFGWNALPAGWAGEPSAWGQTTPEQQAAWTEAFYRRALMEWPWTGGLILENWQPAAPPGDPRWGFALKAADGTLSPAASVIRSLAGESNTALWPGVYPVQAPLARYSGEWEFSDLGADFSEAGGSVVELPFAGESFAVIVRRDNYRGYLFVTVDGQPVSLLPRNERGSYLVLTSPDYQPRIETLPVAGGYGDGQIHQIRLEADRGWDQWALAGYAVGARVDTRRFDYPAVALLVLAIAAVASGLLFSRETHLAYRVGQALDAAVLRLGDAAHFVISVLAALALWLGAALTLGGAVPGLLRQIGDGPSLLLTLLTAGVFYFSPWLVLTLAALMVLFLLIYTRPATGAALMVAFAPYYLLPRPLLDRAFSLVEVISLLTAAAWAIRLAGRQAGPRLSLPAVWAALRPLDKAVGLFVIVSVVSLAWSALPGVAFTELRQMILEPLIVYLVLRAEPLTPRERWRIADMAVLTGVVLALVGFWQFAVDVRQIQGFVCLRSVSGTCNNVALFLGRLIPLAAAVVVMGEGRHRRWLYGGALLVMLLATVLTTSRGALILGIPAGLALVLIFWQGRRGAAAVGTAAALGLGALIPLGRIVPRLSNLFDFSSGTSSSFFRVQLWQSTLRMIRDHPITGLGLDQFLYAYRGTYILPEAWQQPDLSQPHNFILNYWVRLGLFGLLAGLWIQVAFWRTAWAVQRRLRTVRPAERALVIGLMGGMAVFLAHGLVDEVHFVIDLAFLFYMTLGLVSQFDRGMSGGDSSR